MKRISVWRAAAMMAISLIVTACTHSMQGQGAGSGTAIVQPQQDAAARRATALAFYTQTGWPAEKIASHMEGIDFAQPVQVVTLKAGTQVIQYQVPGRPTGNYFTPVGTPPDVLGFNTAGRVVQTYVADADVEVLKSVAADTTTNPNIPVQFRGGGGGTQYFTLNPQAFSRAP